MLSLLETLAVLALGGALAGHGARQASVRITANLPDGCPGVLLLESYDADGRAVSRESLKPTEPVVQVPIPADVARVRVSSPVHEVCDAAVGPDGLAECSLVRKLVVLPFGKGKGRVWARRGGSAERFAPIDPLAPEWGRGFALSGGRLDVVVAPEGGGASMHRLAEANDVDGIRSVVHAAPAWLSARFVDSDGSGMAVRPSVSVQPFGRARRRTDPEMEAWSAFYEANGVTFDRGRLRLDPIPEERVAFSVEFPDTPGIRLVTSGPFKDGGIDLGTVRVPRPTSLTVTLASRLPRAEIPSDLVVEIGLTRPSPGLRPQPQAPRLSREVSIGVPITFAGLLPGEFALAVTSGQKVLGVQQVVLVEGPSNRADLELSRETLFGRVENEDELAVPDAGIGISRSVVRERPAPATRSDDHGQFSVEFLHAGGPVILWTVPGAGYVQTAVEVDPRATGGGEIVLRTGTGCTLFRVVDARTGEAIPDARLELSGQLREGTEGAMSEVSSKEEGEVRFCNIAEGTHDLTVEARRYDRSRRKVDYGRARPTKVEIRLRRAGLLQGTVFGASGAPLAGARLVGPLQLGVPEDGRMKPARSEQDGSFEMDLPDDGSPSLVAIFAPGHRLALRWLKPGPDRVPVALYASGPDGYLTLRFADSSPVGRAFLILGKDGVAIPQGVSEQAAADGGCSIEPTTPLGTARFGGCLEPGAYSLTATVLRPDGFKDVAFGTVPFPQPPESVLYAPGADAKR